MADTDNVIGFGRCPLGCGSDRARYTVTKKQLACATCNRCNCQVFARSDASDELLRKNINAAAPAAPAAAPAPAAEPATPVQPVPPAPPAAKLPAWGFMRG